MKPTTPFHAIPNFSTMKRVSTMPSQKPSALYVMNFLRGSGGGARVSVVMISSFACKPKTMAFSLTPGASMSTVLLAMSLHGIRSSIR